MRLVYVLGKKRAGFAGVDAARVGEMATVPWNELIDKLERLWVIFEMWDELPSPEEDVVPSMALDSECDDWLADLANLTPERRPRPDVAQWLRIRAVAAWALAQSRDKLGATPPRGPLETALQDYLVREWHDGGLREWRFRASLPGPE